MYCFVALVDCGFILNVLWSESLLASDPTGFKNLNFSPKGQKMSKFEICLVIVDLKNRNFQSCCIEHKIVTKRNGRRVLP